MNAFHENKPTATAAIDKEGLNSLLDEYNKMVFLDRLGSEGTEALVDPSIYHTTALWRLINRAAYQAARAIEKKCDKNTVHLSGRAQRISISTSDVLMRFRELPVNHGQLATETFLCPPPIKEILES
ncbi:hypothetical protein FZEAL_8119 [Fusarium zealandicum]|uniref:Uncharacterized protein n=1 Tax=Fusarium zealandicum TaxID=1053134 RepID=A0A8H4UEG2_9HYPO|nr:hypothetical protein FZEAL_8119 [Fusarium zealandicum]